jgi:hypothetical protein
MTFILVMYCDEMTNMNELVKRSQEVAVAYFKT